MESTEIFNPVFNNPYLFLCNNKQKQDTSLVRKCKTERVKQVQVFTQLSD